MNDNLVIDLFDPFVRLDLAQADVTTSDAVYT